LRHGQAGRDHWAQQKVALHSYKLENAGQARGQQREDNKGVQVEIDLTNAVPSLIDRERSRQKSEKGK
jgi:hypothetical protein